MVDKNAKGIFNVRQYAIENFDEIAEYDSIRFDEI